MSHDHWHGGFHGNNAWNHRHDRRPAKLWLRLRAVLLWRWAILWSPLLSLSLLLGACPNSRCSILSESDSTLDYEQVFSPLEYRSDTAAAAECAGLRAERPCLAVYR